MRDRVIDAALVAPVPVQTRVVHRDHSYPVWYYDDAYWYWHPHWYWGGWWYWRPPGRHHWRP